ncbi:hypothetical protein PIIN_05573 [Serendipita indica DSM 11827]|uniref:Uncharacterized protein n=1 Tax=Serendipita indica (strain DSM 11827) TaxID=1109443 RepID=G4TJZ9_SERID|nr:hypothetical protein PIIN_05573 [Serendipita indica DSM 11827]
MTTLPPDDEMGYTHWLYSQADSHIHPQSPSQDLGGLNNQGVFRDPVTYDSSANLTDPPGRIENLSPDPSSSVGSLARDDRPQTSYVLDCLSQKFRASGRFPRAEQDAIAEFISNFDDLYFYRFDRRIEEKKVNGLLHRFTEDFEIRNPLTQPFTKDEVDELMVAFTRLERGGKSLWNLYAPFVWKLSTRRLNLLYQFIWKITGLDPCNRNFVLVQSGKSWGRRLVSLRFLEDYWVAYKAFPLCDVNDVQSDRVNAKPGRVRCHACHNSEDPAIRAKSTFETRQKAAAHVNALHVQEPFRCGRWYAHALVSESKFTDLLHSEKTFSRLNDLTRHWTRDRHHSNSTKETQTEA